MAETDSMVASPKLAAQVAEEVMEFPRCKLGDSNWGERPYVAEFASGKTNIYTVDNNCWRPDIDWSAAGEVLERMRKQRWVVVLRNGVELYRCGFVEVPFTQPNGLVCAETGPLAICLAALAAVRAQKVAD